MDPEQPDDEHERASDPSAPSPDDALPVGVPADAAPEPAPEKPAERATAATPEPPAATPLRGLAGGAGALPAPLAERPEHIESAPRARLAAQSRRDFLLFVAGIAASATVGWWLLPASRRRMLLPGAHDRLDTIAARAGLTPARREALFGRVLTFDDDVAEALYSRGRHVRTYARSDARPIRNNYNGRTPGPEYLADWSLTLSGLATGRDVTLGLDALLARFAHVDQVTRLVCVEGWSGVAWWGGLRFADLLAAFPPAPGARWAAIRSEVNLSPSGAPDPYYVSIDLETARHPQVLLATHHEGRALTLAHGAPLRLLAPMKLGLKNIKAITSIGYSAAPPPDYWNERGYSRYDGL